MSYAARSLAPAGKEGREGGPRRGRCERREEHVEVGGTGRRTGRGKGEPVDEAKHTVAGRIVVQKVRRAQPLPNASTTT